MKVYLVNKLFLNYQNKYKFLIIFVFIFVDDYTTVICESLGAIGSIKSETLLALIDRILNLLLALSELPNPSKAQVHTKTMLCTLIFQTLAGYKWNEITYNTILKVVENNNYWANYCIAREAVRYSHHHVAQHIFGKLTREVNSEHFHFWLVCLKEMSEAETQLYSESRVNVVNRLDEAIIHYNKAIAALKVSFQKCIFYLIFTKLPKKLSYL